MKVAMVVEADKVVETTSNIICVEGTATKKCEGSQSQLEDVQQELQRELEQKRALLVQYQHLMKKTEEERARQLEPVLKGDSDNKTRHRNAALLRHRQIISALKGAQDMKPIAENYRNTFLEYRNSNIARHLPELVERERQLTVEAERGCGKYEGLRHTYLGPETSPGCAHRAQALLHNPMRRQERAGRVRAGRLELQRLWYFAPPSSRCPRLLHDAPQHTV